MQKHALARTGLTQLALATVIAFDALVPVAAAQTGVKKPPASRIVEIQNHGEKFLEATDQAVAGFNAIADKDEFWEAAEQAKQHAEANPEDPEAQEAYRAARSRWLHHVIKKFCWVLQHREAFQKSQKAFVKQLEVEIESVSKVLREEAEAVEAKQEDVDAYLRELQALKQQLPNGAKDLNSGELELLQDVEYELEDVKFDRMLAEDRRAMARSSRDALQGIKAAVQQRAKILAREFRRAERDAQHLIGIARNDLEYEKHQRRRELLKQFEDGLTRLKGKGQRRNTIEPLFVRFREVAGGDTDPDPDRVKAKGVKEDRKQVDEFLSNVTSPDPGDAAGASVEKGGREQQAP